ncbi:MAG: VWA domain-containing protein, partial [Chloroflexi bacterium]|nr:VWA domain-containing protein [Chloroflexota bacterium]
MRIFYEYSRWDGSQTVSPFDADDLMEALSDDLMADGDLRSALERLFRWGHQGPDADHMPGLQQLLEKLRQLRQEQLNKNNLNSVMDDIKERLEKILQTEREGIQRRLEENRQRGPQSPESDQPSAADAQPQPSGDQDSGQPQSQSGQQSGQQQSGQQQSGQQRSGQQQSGQQPSQPGQSPAPNTQDPTSGAPDDLAASMQRMLEQMAAKKQRFLNDLPPDPGGQIKALSDYDFMDPDARQQFQELLQMLQEQTMGRMFDGMMDQLKNMSPEDMARVRDMVRDLNRMMRDKLNGQEPNFQDFMQKHGQFFPNASSFEELMDQLQQRMAQMQSLLQSMTPEMRQQLQDAMDAMLQDDRLRWDMAELAANLEQMFPNRQQRKNYPFRGDDPVTLQEAMRLMEELQNMDQLERQLRDAQSRADLDAVDADKLQDLLGDDARQDLERLRQLTKLLEEAGYIQKKGNTYELTPRGIRKIGQKALQDIFAQLKRDSFGKHDTQQSGFGGERTDDTKPYEFGDPFQLDIERSLMNALAREGIGTPLRLQANDFEVYRNEFSTEASTVLMLDMSRSMLLRGCFLAAKKVALALHSLIKGQYPKDNLYIIGFSAYAHEFKADMLPTLSWDEYEYGTNMQHAFMLARQMLGRHKTKNKQIIVITDGEPTAHLENGRVFFSYPPTYRTIQETLREVVRCTRDRVTINTFMLERGHYLTEFVNQITKINRGRAFFSTPERLGEYI